MLFPLYENEKNVSVSRFPVGILHKFARSTNGGGRGNAINDDWRCGCCGGCDRPSATIWGFLSTLTPPSVFHLSLFFSQLSFV